MLRDGTIDYPRERLTKFLDAHVAGKGKGIISFYMHRRSALESNCVKNNVANILKALPGKTVTDFDWGVQLANLHGAYLYCLMKFYGEKSWDRILPFKTTEFSPKQLKNGGRLTNVLLCYAPGTNYQRLHKDITVDEEACAAHLGFIHSGIHNSSRSGTWMISTFRNP